MADLYSYPKFRYEYDKWPLNFKDTDVRLIEPEIKVETNEKDYPYIRRDPNFITLSNIPTMSEHTVNTVRVPTRKKEMQHTEGGWANGIDYTDENVVQKWIRRKEKQLDYPESVKQLSDTAEKCIKANNIIDIFEEYFEGEVSEHHVEKLNTKTLCLLKDEKDIKRAVSKIAWHPEGVSKLAVGYAIQRFQQMPDKMPNEAYIWDITNPNAPINVLESPSPITCLKFNTKSVGVIAGGCYNGLVLQWDLRMKGKAINHNQACDVELAHQDPVTDLVWQSGKTGTKFVTTSTDGNVYFWDFKKQDEPIPYYEQCTLTEPPYIDSTGGQKGETVCGGTRIAFDINAGPTKFLVGTELGSICQVNARAKKPVEIMSRFGLEGGRHLGPIYQCQRNPDSSMFHYFLTVGDWTAQIWHDELKTPIMRTKFHNSYLSDGCWSPTRQGVFFVITKDGWIKVWDYFYRQNELAFEHKVSDCALQCISMNSNSSDLHAAGKLCAIGDDDGTVTLLELCRTLYYGQEKEKNDIAEMFQREYDKEKQIDKLKQLLKKGKGKHRKAQQDPESVKDKMIKEAEDVFWKAHKKAVEEGDGGNEDDAPEEEDAGQQQAEEGEQQG